jgi:hypothetical protein
MSDACSGNWMGVYTQPLPPCCPPAEAVEVNAKLLRACDSDPPTDEDFTSHVESALPRKKKRANPEKCNHWGLSVWISEEAAAHAQSLFEWLKRKYLFSGELTPEDGKLAQTGKPDHHTFWPYSGVDLIGRFRLVRPPFREG